MKKVYLLPLSMILMTAGYADEPHQAQSENVAQEESVQNPDAEKKVGQQAAAAPNSGPVLASPPPGKTTKPTTKKEEREKRAQRDSAGTMPGK